ncbi:hypothetical protein NC652_002713 [Populus alba x Populus x berolinensis]|uniref:Uncharacterized protein n=1 Tax=Populus alba x Populus x berolinensis TaxID=444605 RepID=A0AAD6RPS1_9ROSI|nr:hypothetical protein NC652_002713 [Populus alba x Populus x berolinensis]KAJ7012859.1 hypothetical protein NC653_002789 [Populus alba x Populus x berolinensis]
MPNKEGNALMWKKGFSEGKGPNHLKKMGLLMNANRPFTYSFCIIYPRKLRHLHMFNAKALPTS